MTNPSFQAEKTYAQMSLEQKLGQLIISYVEDESEIRQLASEGRLGGLYSVRGDTVGDVAQWVAGIQTDALIPLLVCSDFESGNPFAGGTVLPSAMAVGATQNPDLAKWAGRVTAREAKAMGYGLLGSPVVDVNNNPLNPIVNIRSYGEDPGLVSRMATAYLEGVQQEGVLACLKHFPGHGDTDSDSHSILPTISHGMQRMDRVELVPYRAGIDVGVKCVMTTHIIFSELDPEFPATLSRPVLNGLLRSRLGFRGIILSDAMAMHSIAHNYSFDESVAAAIEAGCDGIIPREPMRTFEALEKAYKDGTISPQRLEESVMRMLRAKEELGLPDPMPNAAEAARVGQDSEHKEAAREIAEASISCLGDPDALFPLTPGSAGRMALVTVSNYEDPSKTTATSPGTLHPWDILEEAVRKRFDFADVYHLTPSRQPQIDPSVYHTIVIGVFVQIRAYGEVSGIIPDGPRAGVEKLMKEGRKTFVLSFGSPYPMARLKDLKGCLFAFSDCGASIEAAVKVLVGDIPAKGTLPASVTTTYREMT